MLFSIEYTEKRGLFYLYKPILFLILTPPRTQGFCGLNIKKYEQCMEDFHDVLLQQNHS